MLSVRAPSAIMHRIQSVVQRPGPCCKCNSHLLETYCIGNGSAGGREKARARPRARGRGPRSHGLREGWGKGREESSLCSKGASSHRRTQMTTWPSWGGTNKPKTNQKQHLGPKPMKKMGGEWAELPRSFHAILNTACLAKRAAHAL